MIHTFSESDFVNETNRLCMNLFDSWCNRRCIIPLSFLMHAWPTLKDTPIARVRLLDTLQELRKLHPDSLIEEDHQVIELILEIDRIK